MNPTHPSAGNDAYLLTGKQLMSRISSNPGNMVFLYAIMTQLRGIEHYKTASIAKSDVSIWGCANFIHGVRKMDPNTSLFEIFRTPFVAIGLGAQAPRHDYDLKVPQDTLDWIRKLRSRAPARAPNIALRGEFTRKVLEKHGVEEGTIVVGCPSLFINPSPHLGREIAQKLKRKPEKIAVGPGNIAVPADRLREIEQSLAEIATANGGGYVCQGPEEFIYLARGEYDAVPADKLAAMAKFIRPQLSPTEFRRWLRQHSLLFPNVPAWMEYLQTCDIQIGTRIHGASLALQSGTPALCIAHDARQQELCETLGIPWVWCEQVKHGITVETAHQILSDHDWDYFDANRKVLCRRYIDFLVGNRLGCAPVLSAILASEQLQSAEAV